jgi:hypothetical protein
LKAPPAIVSQIDLTDNLFHDFCFTSDLQIAGRGALGLEHVDVVVDQVRVLVHFVLVSIVECLEKHLENLMINRGSEVTLTRSSLSVWAFLITSVFGVESCKIVIE